jgi:hypothetical protein
MVTPVTSSTKSHQEHVDSDITSPSEAGDRSPAEEGDYCDDDREDNSPRFDYEAIKELSEVVGTALNKDLQLRVSVGSGISINYSDILHSKSTGRGDDIESSLIQRLQLVAASEDSALLCVQNILAEDDPAVAPSPSSSSSPSSSLSTIEEEQDPPTNTEEINFRELCV